MTGLKVTTGRVPPRSSAPAPGPRSTEIHSAPQTTGPRRIAHRGPVIVSEPSAQRASYGVGIWTSQAEMSPLSKPSQKKISASGVLSAKVVTGDHTLLPQMLLARTA